MPEANRWLSTSHVIIVPFTDSAEEWKTTDTYNVAWVNFAGLPLPNGSTTPREKPSRVPRPAWFSNPLLKAISIGQSGSGTPSPHSGRVYVQDSADMRNKRVSQAFAAAGLHFHALEMRSYARSTGSGAHINLALIHVSALNESNTEQPQWLAGAVRRPTRTPLTRAARQAIVVCLAVTGVTLDYTDGGFISGLSRDSMHTLPFTMTHAVTVGHRPLENDNGIMHGIAAGHLPTIDTRLDAAQYECGPLPLALRTTCRADHHGLAIVGRVTEQPSREYGIQDRVRHLTHSRYLDLVLLALRQKIELTEHHNRLTTLAMDNTRRSPEQLFSRVRQLDVELLRFRTTLWSTSVAEHRDGTTVLQSLHRVFDLPAMLGSISESQSELRRVAEGTAIIAEQQRRDSEHRRQGRLAQAIGVTATIAIVPTLVLAVFGLAAESSWAVAAFGSVVALGVTVAAIPLLRRFLNRQS